jgi:hypothetical protein
VTRACLLLLLLAEACSSGASVPAPANGGNGVDDVEKACLASSRWQATTTSACILCRVSAPLAACSCDPNPDRGACLTQAQAVAAEADCSMAITTCIDDCRTDCGCVDGCYAGHAACKSAAAARDGCVVAVCETECK